MPPVVIFNIHLVLGYVATLLCLGAYALPRLRAMDAVPAQRVIATVHSFRFFGLVFMLPGVIGPDLPAGFGAFAAYGDFATGLLAIAALLTIRVRPLFWVFVVAYNLVGILDLIGDYAYAVAVGVPDKAGEFGSTYAIPILYVPALMLTHLYAFYRLMPSRSKAEPAVAGSVTAP